MFVNAFSANSSLSFKISYITFNPKLTPTAGYLVPLPIKSVIILS